MFRRRGNTQKIIYQINQIGTHCNPIPYRSILKVYSNIQIGLVAGLFARCTTITMYVLSRTTVLSECHVHFTLDLIAQIILGVALNPLCVAGDESISNFEQLEFF
jgi:hypothetical protein